MCVFRKIATALGRTQPAWAWLAVGVGLTGLWCGAPAPAGSPPAAVSPDAVRWTPVPCPVELADPAFPERPVAVQRVVQFRDRNGFPMGYALRVVTEVCVDKKCQPVDVTLHWNALGYFERLECPPGKPLTKKEHVPFTAGDYAKLARILKDRDSILARQSLAFLGQPLENLKGVDGLSGATPATVRESVVEHAAYTTWVLWRWANGELVGHLRRLTEQRCTPPYLQHLLRGGDRRGVDFALQYVLAHHAADPQFLDAVVHVLEHADREHSELSLRFVSGAVADKELRYGRLIEAYGRMKSTTAPLVLDYLAADPELPRATLEKLTTGLDRLPYFQVHLLLRLLEQRRFCSPQTEADVVRLLDAKDFFIARRASEFLSQQELSAAAKHKLAAFRERYRDRL